MDTTSEGTTSEGTTSEGTAAEGARGGEGPGNPAAPEEPAATEPSMAGPPTTPDPEPDPDPYAGVRGDAPAASESPAATDPGAEVPAADLAAGAAAAAEEAAPAAEEPPAEVPTEPSPAGVEEPPVPGPVEEPPVPGPVAESPGLALDAPAPVEEPPVPEPVGEPPGPALDAPVPAGVSPAVAPVGPAAPSPPGPVEEPSRAPWIMLGVGIVVVLAVMASLVVVVIARSGPGPEPARAEAEGFVAAWSANDLARMEALVEPAGAPVAADLEAALGPLPVTATAVTLAAGPLTVVDREHRTATVTIELTAPDLPPITYDHTIPLHKIDEDNWRVTWSRSVIHPALPPDGRFDRVRTWASRGTLLDVQGQPIASVAGDVTVSIRSRDVVDVAGVKAALASSLGIDAATVDEAYTKGLSAGQVPIKTISRTEFNRVRATIFNIPGLSFPSESSGEGMGGVIGAHVVGSTGPATAEDAARLGPPYQEGDEIGTSGLQQSQQKTLGGLPATEVRIVDGAGKAVQPIVKVDGSPPTDVRTTIDRGIQAAAEQALFSAPQAKLDNGAALVVVDRSGAIRALAHTSPGGTNWATAQYPPGSTQKVVTSAALLTHGLTPASPLSCPPAITIAGQQIRNFEGESAGTIDFTEAFAISCNTAFLGAAQQLNDQEMMAAVARFGYNVDYDIGIPMKVRGSFPNRPGAIRAAQAIGQGEVLSNPVHMASVAAAVMSGRWQAPTFLAEPPPDRPVAEPLDPQVQQNLIGFMRANVERGSGKAAGVPGKVVHGKTGTAEQGAGSNPPTHAWFIGFSGELAIAVVLHFGGVGGRDAAPIAGAFFSRVP